MSIYLGAELSCCPDRQQNLHFTASLFEISSPYLKRSRANIYLSKYSVLQFSRPSVLFQVLRGSDKLVDVVIWDPNNNQVDAKHSVTSGYFENKITFEGICL